METVDVVGLERSRTVEVARMDPFDGRNVEVAQAFQCFFLNINHTHQADLLYASRKGLLAPINLWAVCNSPTSIHSFGGECSETGKKLLRTGRVSWTRRVGEGEGLLPPCMRSTSAVLQLRLHFVCPYTRAWKYGRKCERWGCCSPV